MSNSKKDLKSDWAALVKSAERASKAMNNFTKACIQGASKMTIDEDILNKYREILELNASTVERFEEMVDDKFCGFSVADEKVSYFCKRVCDEIIKSELFISVDSELSSIDDLISIKATKNNGIEYILGVDKNSVLKSEKIDEIIINTVDSFLIINAPDRSKDNLVNRFSRNVNIKLK